MNRPKSVPENVDGPVMIWKDAFMPGELDAIEALGDALMPARAKIAGHKLDIDRLRITSIAWMERNPQTAWLYARLEEMVLQLNTEFYKFDLFGLMEAFQYTVYDDREGGHYDWHVDLDGNKVEPRKISLSLQLSDPSGYKGCDLVLHAGNRTYSAERARGTLIAFPSYVVHRVTPIESGTRKSLVIWVAGPAFR